ncbi:MAG TPA: hypothetical protein VJS66_01445, partial [Burkholderiales bacterium]|nr:hypothetical protein [Burkholderiales bacterium]
MLAFRPTSPWQSAVYSGVIAAIVSLALETPVIWLLHGELPWTAARMTAAMLLGPDVLSPPTFDLGMVALAFVIHFGLSIFFALILAAAIHGETPFHAAIAGAAFGGGVFFIDMFVLTDVFFPWFAQLRNAMTLF